MTSPDSLGRPGTFAWALGIEDTFIPQLAPGGRILDEYILTQHDRFWRDDLRRIADTGTRHLRYGIPWYRVNPEPGVFDWRWTDEVLPYLVQDLGIAPILDLVHYGAPTWLEHTFLSPDYPWRVAEYAGAVAARYGSLVRSWTPLNEPILHAHFSGRTGAWPPHRRGDRGYAAVAFSLAEGIARTIDAIRAEAPGSQVVHVEAVSSFAPSDPSLEPAARIPAALPYLVADLVEGRVGEGHLLHGWLLDRAIPRARLEALEREAQASPDARRIDVWGVNWYPQMSHYRVEGVPGDARIRRVAGTAADLAATLRDCHRRSLRPVMVTETSVRGRVRERLRWMAALDTMAREVREEGLPFVGITWFPALSLLSWDYRRGGRAPEAYLAHFGLWDLVPQPDGVLARTRTPVADAWEGVLRGWGE
ncbi:MAG TPA: family 1 glycosylhydrolase [Candidatus Limnocylindrales bacterium]|nr:family 1 glycosylhydrolase [Candidatus Limnocylindrales bacterium]